MQRWLSRLSYSFFIVAALLGWEAYQCAMGRRGSVAGWRIGLYVAAAMMALVLGGVGVRARHRGLDQ